MRALRLPCVHAVRLSARWARPCRRSARLVRAAGTALAGRSSSGLLSPLHPPALLQVLNKHQGSAAGVPRLDPVADMGISDPLLHDALAKAAALEQQLADNPGGRSAAARRRWGRADGLPERAACGAAAGRPRRRAALHRAVPAGARRLQVA
jgi:hypothetical protein